MDVIATAMVSSLGYDVHTAYAAARAGLARVAELPFTVLEGDHSPALATGHAAALLAGGFEGDARLVRLLGGAFRDLVDQLPIDLRSVASVAIYLSFPAGDRERQGLNLILNEELREKYLEQIGPAPVVDEAARARRIVDAAIRVAALPEHVRAAAQAMRASIAGHAGVLDLYRRAQADLDSGRVDLAVVAGVDSLLDHKTLNWLRLTGRLKSAESPAGLAPGESAAVVVFGGEKIAALLTAPRRARVDHVAALSSATQFLAGDVADGRSQSEIVSTLRGTIGESASPPWVIVDQNGEVFRAGDWGSSLVRLQGAGLDPGAQVWYPAVSFGDTGAAAGAVATCMAIEAHQRGYAPSTHALVVTSSDGPLRTGCVVSA